MPLSEEIKKNLRQFARQREPYTIPNSAYETALSDGLSVEELREWGMAEERVLEIVGEAPGQSPTRGCTDPNAQNFNPDATVDDGTCQYERISPPPDLTLQEMVARMVEGKMDGVQAQESLGISADDWRKIEKHYNQNKIPDWEDIPLLQAKKTDLWVMGIPGSGKSAMLSAVIGRLNFTAQLIGAGYGSMHAEGIKYRNYLINAYDLNMCPEPTQTEGFNFVSMDMKIDDLPRKYQPVNLIEMAGDKVRDLISTRSSDSESHLVNLDWLDSKNPKIITIVLDVSNDELNQTQDLTIAFEMLRERRVLKRTSNVILLVTKVDLFESFTPDCSAELKEQVIEEVTSKFSTLINTIKSAGLKKIDVVPFSVGEDFVQEKYIKGARHNKYVDEYINILRDGIMVRKLPRGGILS